jgi:hypothetical protein
MKIAIISIAAARPYHGDDPEDRPAYNLSQGFSYLERRLPSMGEIKGKTYSDFLVVQVGEYLVVISPPCRAYPRH